MICSHSSAMGLSLDRTGSPASEEAIMFVIPEVDRAGDSFLSSADR